MSLTIDFISRNIQDVYRLHQAELDALQGEARLRRLVELNCTEQTLNVYKQTFVQEQRLLRNGFPKVHGMVYDLRNGKLDLLNVDVPAYLRKYSHVFTYKQ